MFLTVTIQTYNNAAMLDVTLRGLRTLACPEESDYEILIVNNNSSDHTPQVIRRHAECHLPRMRYVVESRQGLSYARNRALQEAHGEVVCFLDDDVVIDPQWLVAVSTAFAKYSADVVGGRSYLIYPGERPRWLSPMIEGLLSRLDHGDRTLVHTEKDLFGLNFSIRRRLALELGGFRADLGRRGRSLSCGEEIELLDRVRNAGGTVVYEPAATVGHVVKAERLTKRWLLRRAYAGAVAAERLRIAKGDIGRIGGLFIHTARCWGSALKSLLWRRDAAAARFEKEYFAAYSLGRLAATAGSLSANVRGRIFRRT